MSAQGDRAMNQTLKDAIKEVEALPEAEQEELAQALLVMAARKRIDAELAAAEAEGGEIRHEEVFRELQKKFGG
jgi:hypothetical protein